MGISRSFQRLGGVAITARRVVSRLVRLGNPISTKILEIDDAPVKTARRVGSLEGMFTRPEGMALSPSGELLICNSKGGTNVAIYSINGQGTLPKFEQVVSAPDMSYFHGAYALENFYVVAARDAHTIAAFAKQPDGRYARRWELRGKRTRIGHPAGVTISSDRQHVIAANRSTGITIHRLDLEAAGIRSDAPRIHFSNSFFDDTRISEANDVVALPGNRVAVLHKSWPESPAIGRMPSAISVIQIPDAGAGAVDPRECVLRVYRIPNVDRNHSISYHAASNSLLINDEHRGLFRFRIEADGITFVPVVNIRGMVDVPLKGIALAHDGKTLFVSGEFDRVDLFADFE